jgi:SAM-dependent methyltransferase
MGDERYLFPRHPGEIDRLDVQHYALRLTIGANYVAPIAAPRAILESGSGSGQWAHELCRQFPAALVAGIDVRPGKDDRPPNFGFVRGDLLRGLPFADGAFDFVHQRLLVPAIPLSAWAGLVAELARVTRPGGWVELVEADWKVERAGPASERLVELACRLGRTRGMDVDATIFHSLDRCLGDAGLTDVERRLVELPLGDWGGRAGSLMATDYRAAATRLSEVYGKLLAVPAEECLELIRAASREWEELRSTCVFAVAIGRKSD